METPGKDATPGAALSASSVNLLPRAYRRPNKNKRRPKEIRTCLPGRTHTAIFADERHHGATATTRNAPAAIGKKPELNTPMGSKTMAAIEKSLAAMAKTLAAAPWLPAARK